MKLNAKQLRVSRPKQSDLKKIKRREIYIVCDNVLDTYNIGSIFRLADAVGVKCVYLCGQSETPPNPRIAKASVGTDKWVDWKYKPTTVETIRELKKKFSTSSSKNVIANPSPRHSERSERISSLFGINSVKQSKKREIASSSSTPRNDVRGIRIVAIEQGRGSIDYRKADYREPIAFVVGNETEGVSYEALKFCDQIVEIPMFGINASLNVMVSLAIVLYRIV